ncbi:MAG: hypothetical protein ABH877_05240, partial [bacterium]
NRLPSYRGAWFTQAIDLKPHPLVGAGHEQKLSLSVMIKIGSVDRGNLDLEVDLLEGTGAGLLERTEDEFGPRAFFRITEDHEILPTIAINVGHGEAPTLDELIGYELVSHRALGQGRGNEKKQTGKTD